MKMYVVRMKENHSLAGIFYADSPARVAYLIDQLTDPNDCEYAELPVGGLLFPGDTATVKTFFESDENRETTFVSEEWKMHELKFSVFKSEWT